MIEELEMDTKTLCFTLAEMELEDCIRLEMKSEWDQLRSNDCMLVSQLTQLNSFLNVLC